MNNQYLGIMKRGNIFLSALAIIALAGCDSKGWKQTTDGVTVKVSERNADGPALVRLQVKGGNLIRVTATPESRFADRKSLIIVPQEARPEFTVSSTDSTVSVVTSSVTASVRLRDGAVNFSDRNGTKLLDGNTMSFTPITVEGRSEYSTAFTFDSPEDEAFYGLGQQQSMEFNHKGGNEELFQYNTKVSIPFVVSNRGYGVLVDNYSLSRWGNPKPYLQLNKAFKLYGKDGREGGLTGTYTPATGGDVVRQEDSLYYENEWVIANLPKMPLKGANVSYEGFIEAPQDSEYHFILYYAGFQSVSIGGKEVVSERWRPAWNPNSYKFTVSLKKGEKTPINVRWRPDGDVSYIGLRVAEPRTEAEQSRFSFWSEMSPELDYYYIAGNDMDEVISGYRTLTGKAQVMPKWALGFWQSRERYSTQEDLVGTLAELRRRNIPVDNIVQDWQYWKDDQWGSHEFDETRYSDPEKMLDDVHAMHGRFMISVWPKFYVNTDHYKELKEAGYVYTLAEKDSLKDWLGYVESFYDAYSEGGRKMFWKQMDESLYSKFGRKIDSWWMDASEPNLRDCLPMDYQKALTTPTALGPSTEYLNAYALVNADAIYNGQRGIDPDKRVFLLTRSGFAGLQRYSTSTWSGDIGTCWNDMRAQMAAGLNFSMSGVPFWGMDIGGFSVMDKFMAAVSTFDNTGKVTPDLDEWRELQTRWHQFGTFVPLFRTHGQWPRREIWNIAPEGTPTYSSILYYMRLRYRLMPYLYSLTGAVHFEDYTMLRGLPMDFASDRNVADISDQWMFGPALMPCPVSEYKVRSRSVYFPQCEGWYDFYNGKFINGGQTLIVDAPYEYIPLYVRAGSIIPFGPEIQWSDEKPADVIDLYVYAGKDGSFTLYEDENVNYNYEKGAYSTITFTYDDSARTLTLGDRKGEFPGMLTERKFNIVLVTPENGFAYPKASKGVETVYNGAAVTVNL